MSLRADVADISNVAGLQAALATKADSAATATALAARPLRSELLASTGAAAIGTAGGVKLDVILTRAYELHNFDPDFADLEYDGNAGPAFQGFFDSLDENALYTARLVLPRRDFTISTEVVYEGTASFIIETAGGGGSRFNKGTANIYVDGAITAFTIGYQSSTAARWAGPRISGLYFIDKTPGTALGGVRFLQSNSWHLLDCGGEQFTNGYGVLLDGGDDYCQYGTLTNCRFSDCKKSIALNGLIADIWVIGGYYHGNKADLTIANPPVSTGIGWLDPLNPGYAARMKIDCGLNNHAVAVDMANWAQSRVFASIEQNIAITGQGKGCVVSGNGVASRGWNNIIQCQFNRLATAIEYGANTRYNSHWGSQFSGCTTTVDNTLGGPNGTFGGSHTMAGFPNLDWPVLNANGDVRSIGFGFRRGGGTSSDHMMAVNHTASSMLVASPSTINGGFAFGSQSENQAVFGAGIWGDPSNPKASETSGAFLRANGAVMNLHMFSGVAVNSVVGLTNYLAGSLVTLLAVTPAQLADATSYVNTIGKYIGRIVRDSTNNRLYRATGSSATSQWAPLETVSGLSTGATSDASGDVTIAISVGFTPVKIFLDTLGTTNRNQQVVSRASVSFKARTFNPTTGAAITSASVPDFSYEMIPPNITPV